MKVNSKLITIFVFIFVFGGASIVIRSQAKGGGPRSSRPVEPYGLRGISIDAVRQMRRDASTLRTMRDTVFQSTTRFREVGFAFIKNKSISGTPLYQLRGAINKNKWISVDFSDIESISFLKQARGQVLLKVIIFPDISPEELLRVQPDYSSLRSTYTKEVSLWVPLEDGRKGELSLIGKSSSDGVSIIAKLRDIKLNTVLEFEYGSEGSNPPPIWWAIPSVVQDPKYPFRRRRATPRR